MSLAAHTDQLQSHGRQRVDATDPIATAYARSMNRLAAEPSPYLRQHANNPVDWYPWGDEALAEAISSNRPILLSVGYSSCHWCHVMAHESFEDPEIAVAVYVEHGIGSTHAGPVARTMFEEYFNLSETAP